MAGKYKGKSGYVLEKGKSGKRWKKRRQFNFIETARKRGRLGQDIVADYNAEHKDSDMQTFKGARTAGALATMLVGGPLSPVIADRMYRKTDSDTFERMRANQSPELRRELRKDAMRRSAKGALAGAGVFGATSAVQALTSGAGSMALKGGDYRAIAIPAAVGAYMGSGIGGFSGYASSPLANSTASVQNLAINDTIRDRAVKNALKLGLPEAEAHSLVDANYGDRAGHFKTAREAARGQVAIERGIKSKDVDDDEADQRLGEILKDLNKIRRSQGKKAYSNRTVQQIEDKELARGVAALFGGK